MTLVNDFRKTVTDTTPVYAAVGVTDLAVEILRDASSRAAALRVDLDVTALQSKAVNLFEKAAEQAQQLPGTARAQTLEVFGKARETYSDLAVRGEKLVNRIRNQKSTQDLFAQAGSTLNLGKGAVTTVRKAALETQRAAKLTLATGRREAGSLASSVQDDVRSTGRKVSKAAAATRSAAEGTATAAKKGADSAKSATKGVSTSAKKTATTASAAAKTATPKVGD
jgi:heparin binding hemagglutinin HbhA